MEAVLLTGGASRRMGVDKASIDIAGEPLAQRIARLIANAGLTVTVLGREPLPGHAFLPDEIDHAGPLTALARFRPREELIFVASCDLPGFHPDVILNLKSQISNHEAAIPLVEGRLQPLCALYRASAFAKAAEQLECGDKRIMSWIEALGFVKVEGLDPTWTANANTPADLPKSSRA